MTCKDCIYYKPDYGVWCVNGWSQDGSSGYCHLKPRQVPVSGYRIRCQYFEPKSGLLKEAKQGE